DGLSFLEGKGEGCLVFEFSVDSFEPIGMKPGKKSYSSTGIWVICYKFLPHLHYPSENIYLMSIITGLHKLDTHHINPYI
ncbi:hypothetical protein BDN71DRAFT_1347914, partial [Pleurotus eryngii]